MLKKYEEQWIKDNKSMLYIGVPVLGILIIILGILLQIPE